MTGPHPRSSSSRRLARAAGTTALCAALGIGLLAPAAASAAPPEDAPPSASALQADLDRLTGPGGFPGALAAVRGADGEVHDLTAGVGDLATRAPVPVDGEVRIASNTKTFVSAVVLQLVGEGRVQLDSPVETYLPGLLRGEGIDGHAITVRQLLQHTSGLPEYVDQLVPDLVDGAPHRFVEPHQLLAVALSRPAVFAPGTAWQDSNTNYVVAGLLVQEVTGRPVGEEVTRRVVEPLELAGTYWPAEGEVSLRGEHPHGYFAAAPGDRWPPR
ncbi:serine hydrolase domain-containing protein [Modestobacter sp. I12A-02662]|uniref:serine hydrolase domain-containing protein n=1 Tax=Modestobacter sp. I12A-02662 TaxID=1730496 RepID=UPI0034DF10F3